MKLRYLLYFSLLIHLFSCQNSKIKGVEMGLKTVEFEEINHINFKLIDSEYQILKSQDEINVIYKKINDNNPSPRKNPIPSYNEDETYIVLQPKIDQSDFTVEGISESNQSLKIKIHPYSNPEFKDTKHSISVIKLNKNKNYKSLEFNK
jgi:hypothetical protein